MEGFTGEWVGGYGLKKRRRGEKPGGQLDCQDAAFHARSGSFHLPLLPEETGGEGGWGRISGVRQEE